MIKLIPKLKLLAGCLILSLSGQAYAEYYFVYSVRELSPTPCVSCHKPAPCARSHHRYKHKRHYVRPRSSCSISINYFYASRTCSVCGCGDAWAAAANEYSNCGERYAEPCYGGGCGSNINVCASNGCGMSQNYSYSDDFNYDTDTGDNDFY